MVSTQFYKQGAYQRKGWIIYHHLGYDAPHTIRMV